MKNLCNQPLRQELSGFGYNVMNESLNFYLKNIFV